MSTSHSLPNIGDVIDDRYEVLSELGAGGFGAVYLGRQRSTGQQVAIKLLRSDRFSADELVEAERRLERELRLVGEVSHPHIVRLIDGGRLPGGQVYLALEYVDGEELADLLERHGPLVEAQCVHLMTSVLDALCAAHALGIVHRDLKPQNIMITHSGALPNATVLDFGISGVVRSARGEGFSSLTATGQVLGTPAYMAPEQLHANATAQTDVYAWGLIFLECLTGQRVVQATSPVQAITWQISDAPVPIPEAILARPLGRVIQRATAKSTAQRYPTADAALADLVACTTGAPLAAAPMRHAGDSVTTDSVTTDSDAAKAPTVASGPTIARPPTVVAAPGGPLPTRAPHAGQDAAPGTALVGDPRRPVMRRGWLYGLVGVLAVAALIVTAVLLTRGGGGGGNGGSHKPTLRVKITPAGKIATSLPRVWAVALSPNGTRLAAGGDHGRLEISTPGTSKIAERRDGGAIRVTDLAYSADGRWLAAATLAMSKIRLWDRSTGKHEDVGSSTEPIQAVAFTPDSRRLVYAPGHRPIVVLDVATHKVQHRLKGHLYPISALAVSPNGERLAAAGWGKAVHLWDLASGRHLHALRGHGGEIKALAFSADGKSLASAGADGAIRLWNPRSGKVVHTLQKGGTAVWGLAAHPSRPLLVSGGEDRHLTLWDLRHGRRISRVDHTDPVGKVSFDAQGKLLATATWAGAIRLWRTRF